LTDPAHDRYRHFPVEAAVYVQDKIEMHELIVNLGVRLDYFDPDGKVLSNPYDPNPYDPIDSVARSQTLDQRLSYWFRDVDPKVQISPRIGIAYPISDRGVLHFAYGHFFQRPRFEYLYTNPEFELDTRTENLFGNADLNPEKTVTYEFGLQQEIVQDLAVQVDIFARDIRDLTSTDKIVALQGGYKYNQYVNRDFGQVRGITLSLDKRHANNFSAFIDYTYQVAEGNASDPQAAYNASKGNREPEKELVPLDWDRRHTLNATLNYSIPDNWGFSVIGKLGSGLPYTPEYQGLRTSFENDGRKPSFWNVDVTAFKSLSLKRRGLKLTLEASILNLLDTKNENDVYKDTGRATYSQEDLLAYEVPQINSLAEYWMRTDWYSRPRQVRVGLSFEF
jgi:outer membrane receptor for ferrienterochelin and colicin